MNVQKYLDNFYKGTKNPTLEAMKYFMNKYDNIQNEMKFIHIAGTNGKGSCTETITKILLNAGYRVGKFISPHLVRYNERISVNNINIADNELEKILLELEPLIKEYNIKSDKEYDRENKEYARRVTLFELETTVALLYFYRKDVDFVVLETGLGGLYDCTNIVRPLISIITSIGYDHMQILGNTLEEIAEQKAGIIKENSNTIIFEQEDKINKIFREKCKEKNNKIHIVKNNDISNVYYDSEFQHMDYKDMKNLYIKLKGKKQIQNSAICLEAIKILNELGYKISNQDVRDGLKTVIHRARFEVINKKPLIIYDGAHNEPAIRNLKDTINMYYKDNLKTYIISILKTKDYKMIVKLLLEDKTSRFIFTSGIDADIYISKEKLYKVAKEYNEKGDFYTKELEEAINSIVKEDLNRVNFIVGSFYTYGTVEGILNKNVR